MQLSTSFLPFDLNAPAAAASPSVPAIGVTAAPVEGDFDALLAEAAPASTVIASGATPTEINPPGALLDFALGETAPADEPLRADEAPIPDLLGELADAFAPSAPLEIPSGPVAAAVLPAVVDGNPAPDVAAQQPLDLTSDGTDSAQTGPQRADLAAALNGVRVGQHAEGWGHASVVAHGAQATRVDPAATAATDAPTAEMQGTPAGSDTEANLPDASAPTGVLGDITRPASAERQPPTARTQIPAGATEQANALESRYVASTVAPAANGSATDSTTTALPASGAAGSGAAPLFESPSRISRSATTATTGVGPAATREKPLPRSAFAEKFAAYGGSAAADLSIDPAVAKKISLSYEDQQVANVVDGLGTNAAKPESFMTALASSASSSTSAVERLSHAAAPLSFEAHLPEAGSEAAELVQTARRAVSTAVSLTEQFNSGEKQGVTLKFSVSGVDLGVRVELRGDNLHTTFRTDSPELRAALAQEWQAVAAAQPGDRPSRLADPVFTSSSSGQSTSADFGGADQRGAQSRYGQATSEQTAAFRSTTPAPAAAPAEVATPAAQSAPRAMSGRLHTFA